MMKTIVIPINGPYLIVGSYPLNIRYSKDIDVICYEKDIDPEARKICSGDEYILNLEWDGRKLELLLADKQESLQELLRRSQLTKSLWGLRDESIDTFEACYVLKAGHIHIAGKSQENWQKHISDYHYLKKRYDNHYLNTLIVLHRKCTNERIKQRHPKLKGISVSDFFDDLVKKYVTHDLIHEKVAHCEKPRYSYMQKDNTVECHKDLWDTFTFEEKIQTVAEECYVIAIERQILPTLKGDKVGLDGIQAFKWALYRVCTTLCSGWFRQFAIDNYFTILNYYDKRKIEKAIKELC